MTRLKAALLDLVKATLDHLSAKLEPSDLEQSLRTSIIEADLKFYARVISTFAVVTSNDQIEEEVKEP